MHACFRMLATALLIVLIIAGCATTTVTQSQEIRAHEPTMEPQ